MVAAFLVPVCAADICPSGAAALAQRGVCGILWVVNLAHLETCLFGGAAGDCVGAPYEGGPPRPIGDPFLHPWRVTDDTILTLATCRAIAQAGRVDPAAIAQAFVDEHRRQKIPGLGSSTLKALRDLDAGAHWALSGTWGERAAGNGAAMRIAPLAFFLDPRSPDDRKLITDVCRITHKNDEAIAGALAVVHTMHKLAQPSTAAATAADVLLDIANQLPDSNTRDKLHELAQLGDPRPTTAAALTGTSGYAAASVPLAIHIAVTIEPIDTAILAAVSCGGDTDTIASMVGQMQGAAGRPLPPAWQDAVPCAVEVRQLCATLSARAPG